MYYLLQETQRTTTAFREGIDQTGHALANNVLDLYCGGFQKIRKVKHLEVVLMDGKIAYHK